MDAHALATMHREMEESSFMRRGDNLLLAHLLLPRLPMALESDLAALRMLEPAGSVMHVSLIDLLLHGESSETHEHLLKLYGDLTIRGVDRVLESMNEWRDGIATSSHASFQWLMLNLNGRTPEAVPYLLSYLSYDAVVSATRTYVSALPWHLRALYNPAYGSGKASPAERAADFFTEGVDRALEERPEPSKWREIPAWQLLLHQDRVNEFSLTRFYAEAMEYNWDWAVASFDWSCNVPWEDTFIGRMQGVVDASPWS